jgi:hypothetical protein
MAKYMILQGDGRTVQGQLDKFSKEGYVPILYSTVVVGATATHPGQINHCMVIELKETSK